VIIRFTHIPAVFQATSISAYCRNSIWGLDA